MAHSEPPPRVSERPASRAPSGRPTRELHPHSGRQLWVASWDLGGLQQLGLRLHGRATVTPVRDPAALRFATAETIVLLDACAPEIDALAAARTLVATRATVVVWGADAQLKATLAREENTRRWVHVPTDTTPAELAEILASLFGP
ncbi:MAG TPA: hypothetical protein RMH85_11300 [Polyangiaceae bacterium LLY-WYZ-15_(1-7)]|nr:hypothetical protein [Polyangiaceae bacterium LLY-WYZ-15_(1-7)]HJL09081.1 hypothetical protein [Polyangiaceae bacterium LLY-WYZ-15_(1-7)]HJL21086.1 hypothetical protein [Polyangiaceae bacterium LLY-WYZ-15_(1-7)]HJL36474.1 hypothetical protein [Polyangiaceae bacterium LLY-WYZ-15_(1-7)]HJL50897.1 hypothetical protein [Polyangiaceae bacterium LLY-WYZ-15_(1-7)]